MNKKKTVAVRVIMAILLLLFTSGCMKTSLPYFYYTLDSSAHTTTATTPLPDVIVGPIHIVSSLNKGQLISQNSAYSITINEQHRWAGNLQEMFLNTLMDNLSAELADVSLYSFPNTYGVKGLQVKITLLHFEKDTHGDALTQARWKILNEDQVIIHAATSSYTIQPDDSSFTALVKGLSIGLSRLSKEIANTIIQSGKTS